MTLWQRVVQANKPGPPEHSVPFRVASAATVVVAAAACWSQGELSPAMAGFAIVATVVGNALSYWRRERPWPAVKPILAVCALGGFVWFITTVTRTATPGDISTVESPLAVLFAWVLCTHAFDVPARRDVAYSLAGSAALMAVAAAQSVDLALGVYVVAWVAFGLWGLVAMWQSMSGTRGVPWLTVGGAGLAVLVVAALLVAVLPAPKVSTSLIFPSSSAGSPPVDTPNNLTDGSASLPAHAASPSGPTRVGGYLGFAKSLDTGVRASLGNQVVMRVRASRPSFWVGQSYDTWNGQSWLESAPAKGQGVVKLDTGSPFEIPLSPDQQAVESSGDTDIQTFYVAQSGPNLVFHADNAERVYIQSRVPVHDRGRHHRLDHLDGGRDHLHGGLRRQHGHPGAAAGRHRAGGAERRRGGRPQPEPVRPLSPAAPCLPRVAALARSITAGIPGAAAADPHTYDKVEAIERWMADHIRYTTDIPPLPAGADAVSSFLFGTRLGFCEQISTATVVMLRSLGIPARETVGYVPGSYDPITDLYDVQAKDAHAWVQVWFPGYGWQNFDPTADVPLANPSPGSVLARTRRPGAGPPPVDPHRRRRHLVATVLEVRRRRLRRPPTWAHQIAADLERGGARVGSRRLVNETLSAYGIRLAAGDERYGAGLTGSTQLVERYTYGGVEPSAEQIGAALDFSRHYRQASRRRRPGSGTHDRDTASASSNEAPAASRGR